jgi:hypothetical protein
MPEWIPMFAMPNVQPQNPIELDGIAFVSAFDDRIKALRGKYRNYDAYLNQFSDEFGVKLNPGTIMVWEDAPLLYRRVDALSSFRDAVSIASISKTWAHILRYGGHMDGPRYSNTFSFYPWLLDENYNNVATQSIAVIGVQQLASMHAQSVPAFSFCRLLPNMVDHALLNELLKRWAHRYSTEKPHWKDRALFRSLNMANAAANLRGHADVTHYDLGRLIALWVSAFEILAHPPYGRQNGYRQVYALLNSLQWRNSRCREKRFSPYPHKRGTPRSNLPCWLYGQLNSIRDDFIHGNRVGDNSLITKRSHRAIQSYAVVLYRMALAAFLDLKFKERLKSPTTKSVHEQRKSDFEFHQGDAESALGSICYTAQEWNDIQNGQLSPDLKKWP